MKRYLYWDEDGEPQPAKMTGKKGGTPIVHSSKVSRTKKLYEDFKALSQIEKENFVNMIRNFVVHGHL